MGGVGQPCADTFLRIGRALNTSGLAKLIRDSIRPTLKAHGYEWKQMYAGPRGAVTETNRYTKGNTQVAAYLFGHTPEIEAKTT
jgi:hypothetical protein